MSITGGSQATVDLRPKALAVLSLLLDQEKLAKQRRWSDLWRHGAFSHLRYHSTKTELLIGTAFGAKQFPSFAGLHKQLTPPSECGIRPTNPAMLTGLSTSSSGQVVVIALIAAVGLNFLLINRFVTFNCVCMEK